MIASGSFTDTTGGTNETDNFSFETGTTNNTGTEPRGGQNIGSIPNNWIFHSGSNSGVGTAVSQSLTNRTNYTTNTAHTGSNTFDIFVEESDFDTIKPLSYSFHQVVDVSAAEGKTIFASIQTRNSHSLQGSGGTRSMDNQFLSLWYLTGSAANPSSSYVKFAPVPGFQDGEFDDLPGKVI